jgi:hypothetical protein
MLLWRSSAHAATTTGASVGANAVSVDLREACRRCQLQVQHYPIRPDVAGPKWNSKRLHRFRPSSRAHF